MKIIAIAFALGAASFLGGAAYACDCQKNKEANQQEQQKGCACGAGQSCPGECNHAAEPPKQEKKKTNKKS